MPFFSLIFCFSGNEVVCVCPGGDDSPCFACHGWGGLYVCLGLEAGGHGLSGWGDIRASKGKCSYTEYCYKLT